MIGPTSETGKTMLASLQAAMGRGMPVDQAITYVKSMAQQGVAPLVDLYALLKQFERLKQPQIRPPQNQNLREQLNSLEAGPSAMGPQAGAPMEMGLGALDAGSMQNPQFAGGGIIAFQEGGETESFTPELYTLPQTRKEAAQQAIERANRMLTPEGQAEAQRRRDAEMKARGLGRYAKSLEMREKYAERLGEEAELLPEELAALDEEAYWADVAATSEPDFLSALAKAKPKAVERKRSRKEKAAAAKEKAELEKILRQEAREAIERGDYEALENIRKELKGVVETSTEAFLAGKEKEETQATMRAQVALKGVDAVRAELAQEMRKIGDPDDPTYKKLLREYNNLTPGIASAQMRGAGTKANPADMQKLKDLGRQLQQLAFFSDDDPRKVKLQQEYDALYGRMVRGGVDVEAELAAPQGSTEMPPGFQPLNP